MKLNQFARNRNLFTNDQSIQQHPSLYFKNEYTERLYNREAFRFSVQSCIWWYLCIILLLVFSSWYGNLKWQWTVIGVLMIGGGYWFRMYDKIAILLILNSIILYYAVVCSDKGNILEALGIFLLLFVTNFFTVKRWVFIIPIGLLLAGFMKVVNGQSIVPYLFGLFISCILGAMFEKDHRDLWTLYYTYKKSEIQHKQLYLNSTYASFILNYEGRVIYSNKQAAEILKYRDKPLSILKSGKLEDVFDDEHKERFKILVQKAMAGEGNSEEFLLNLPDVNLINLDNNILGYNISAEPIAWCTGNCILVTCFDITHYVAIRAMLANQYRDLLVPFTFFSKELERLYGSHEPPDRETICIFNKISQDLRSILTLHLQFVSRIEHRPEVFDVGTEIQNIIEKSFYRAACRGIEIAFTKEKCLSTVYGDKTKLNLLIHNLLEFAIAKSIEESEISLFCDIAPPVEGALMLSFRFNFLSRDLDSDELDKLFLVRKNGFHRRNMNDLIEITHRYGVHVTIIDILLLVLRGYIVDSYVQEHNKNKTVIILQ